MKRLAILLLFVFVFLLFVHDEQSYDVWWHLKTGQYIVQNFSVPHTDIYSQFAANRPWIDMQWFFQAAAFLLYSLGGFAGLILFKALLLVLMFWLIFKAVDGTAKAIIAMPAVFLAALCLWERALLRPEILSFFYLGLFLCVLHVYKYRGKETNIKIIYVLPLVQLFWVNSHALFVLGILLVWSYIAGESIERRIEGDRFRHLLIAGVLVVLVSLVSPYGYQGFIFPFTLFTRINGSREIFSSIGEFQPPFSYFCQNSTIFYYKLLLVFSGAALLLNLRRLSLAHLVSYSVFLYLSLLARRNIPFFALVCLPIVVENLSQVFQRLPLHTGFATRLQTRYATGLGFGLAAIVFSLAIIDVAGGAPRLRGDGDRRLALTPAQFKYPAQAAEFVIRAGIKGNIFNDLQSGNYLVWAFYPERKVFLDGRLEVHSPDFYAQYLRLLADPRIWPALAKKYDINYALFSHVDSDTDRLLVYLSGDHDWRLVFFDDVSVVFVRDVPANRDIIAAYQTDLTGHDFAGPPPSRGMPERILSRLYFQRGNLFAKFSNFDKAVQNYTIALAYDLSNDKVHINMGRLYSQAGNVLAAEREYQAALAINPHSALALFNLAGLYYRTGDLPLALTYYSWAVAADPGFADADANVGSICLENGQYRLAAAAYARALKVRPWDPDIRLNLGVAYARMGLLEKARQEFLKVQRLDPENALAARNLKKLDSL